MAADTLHVVDLHRLLDERASCRAFTPEPVARETIEAIFSRAQRAPSWCNTQPWQVHLLSGDAQADFSKQLTEYVAASEQYADLGLPTYTGAHAERRRESGHGLYAHLGIARDDHLARGMQMLKNFSFFDAPHTAVVTTDRDLGTYGAVDCGGYVNTLMLLIQAAGLGVIAQGAIAMYSDFVRTWLDLPDDRLVVCAVSFGHADTSAEVNDFRTTRADLTSVLTHLSSTPSRTQE